MNLEREIGHRKRKLYSQQHIEEGVITEFKSHLRDDIERMTSNGIAEEEEEAFKKVVENIGDIDMIDSEELKTTTHNNTAFKALFINFTKVSKRQFLKNKTYSLIKLGGLIIAFVSLLFIALFTYDENSFEQMHPDIEKIYSLAYTFKGEDGLEEKRAFYSAK
jgi:hypothetical protein